MLRHAPSSRTVRTAVLPGLMAVLSGCAGLGGSRPAIQDEVRTITLIGDRPITVAAGEPGASIASDPVAPTPAPSPDRRIAGRVVDASGRPVPDATVRLAVNGLPAGRDAKVLTDEAGRFTLSNLRQGSEYTVIAEWRDESGRLQTGRARAAAPESQIEIALETGASSSDGFHVNRVATARDAAEGAGLFDEADTQGPGSFSRTQADDLPNFEDLPADRHTSTLSAAPESRSQTAARNDARSEMPDVWRRGEFGGSPIPQTTPIEEDIPNPLPPAREVIEDVPYAARAGSPVFPPLDAPNEPLIEDASAMEPPVAQPPRFPSLDEPEPAYPPMQSAPAGRSGGNPAASSDSLIDAALSNPPDGSNVPRIDSPTDQPAAAPPTMPSIPPTMRMGTDPASPAPPSFPPLDEGPRLSESPSPTPAPLSSPPTEVGPPSRLPAFAPPSSATPVESESDTVADDLAAEDVLNETARVGPPPTVDEEENGPAILNEPPPAIDQPPAIEAPADESEPSIDDIPPPIEPAPELSRRNVPPTAGTGPRTWGELTAQAHRDTDSPASRPGSDVADSLRTLSLAEERMRQPVSIEPARFDGEIVPAACSYDRRQQRIQDFQLPGLDGRPVRFRDLKADFILVDFWGTWCGPCVRAIPHLVELQERFGPETLQVVGIAYELEGTPHDRAVGVASVARRLGVTYPLLLGEADGRPCPLQAALHVQAYPTLVLFDRDGRILWRGTGAEPKTFATLEKVLIAQSRHRNRSAATAIAARVPDSTERPRLSDLPRTTAEE